MNNFGASFLEPSSFFRRVVISEFIYKALRPGPEVGRRFLIGRAGGAGGRAGGRAGGNGRREWPEAGPEIGPEGPEVRAGGKGRR